MDNDETKETDNNESITKQMMNQDLACIKKQKEKTTASLTNPSEDKEENNSEDADVIVPPELPGGYMPEEDLEEDSEESDEEDFEGPELSEADKLKKSIIGDTTQEQSVDNAKKENNEEDVYDAAQESMKYKGSDSDSVSYEEIQEDLDIYTDSEEIKENELLSTPSSPSEAKKSFAKATMEAEKKKYLAGKVNKNLACAALGVLLLISLGLFLFTANHSVKKGKEKTKEETKVTVGGYNPDFGDYKSRKYVQSKEEEKIQQVAEAEKLLTDINDDKEDYIPINEDEIRPYYQSTYTAPKNSYQGTYDESKDPVALATKSDIRVKAEGFGIKTKASNYSNTSSETKAVSDNPYNLTDEQVAQKYIDRVNQLSSVNQSVSSNEITDNRWSTAGAYNQALKGGDIRTIPSCSLYPGTVIEAVLVNGINTDYPGTITARVISNVYDSKTGTHLLIPSGSIIRGSYSSSSIGIARVQIAWQSLIMNRDGMDYIVNLGSMVGVDKSGYSGIKGSLSEHAFQYVKAAGLSALFTCINSNIHYYKKNVTKPVYEEMIDESSKVGNILAEKILDRALDIQPTVKVKPGTRICVDVDKVLTLIPYDNDLPVKRYVRQ